MIVKNCYNFLKMCILIFVVFKLYKKILLFTYNLINKSIIFKIYLFTFDKQIIIK